VVEEFGGQQLRALADPRQPPPLLFGVALDLRVIKSYRFESNKEL